MRSIGCTALLLCLSLLVACGGGDQVDANTLHRGLQVAPESLDPHRSRSSEGAEVLRDLGEGLVGYSPSGELVPAAAERWDVSDDGLTFTLNLRKDAKFHDGEPVTSEDVAFTIETRRTFSASTLFTRPWAS